VLYVAIVISHKNVYDAQNELSSTKWVIWLYRIFVNNGLTFYATWITVATSLNLAIAITYKWTGLFFKINLCYILKLIKISNIF